MNINSYFNNASLSVDKISFSIFIIGNVIEKDFFVALKDIGFEKCKFDSRNKDKKMNYKRIRKYLIGNSVIVFLYKRRNNAKYLPEIFCTFQDPSKPILNLLDSLCNSFGFSISVSQVEIAVDFPYSYELQEFFWEHLYVKYNRGNPCIVGKGTEQSYYSGHKAKNGKITNLYTKTINGVKHLRLELILNRRIIKRIGFDLRLEGINDIHLREFLCFKTWNVDRFYRYLEYKYRGVLREMNPKYRSFNFRCIKDIELNKSRSPYAMPIISHLKKRGYQRPHRFLDDMPKTNEKLYNLLAGNQFLQ